MGTQSSTPQTSQIGYLLTEAVLLTTAHCASSASFAADLDLPGSQLDLLHAVTSRTDTPVVVVLISCRPATFGSGGQSKFGPVVHYHDLGLISKLLAQTRMRHSAC